MTYDPAWDMPRQNWQQQGSFETGQIPPVADPDAGTLVCLPPINQDWLPYLQGCLSQLTNPSTWLVADDDAMYDTLTRVNRLRQMLGERADCGASMMIRYDGASCQLQQSVDGGTTWTEVDGWNSFNACLPPQTILGYSECVLRESLDGGLTYTPVPGWADNFTACVQSAVPIIGLPPNPQEQSPAQLSCSIAVYLANQIIIGAMGKAVTAIQDDLTLLQFGLSVLDLIPEFVIVTAGVTAFSTIYAAVEEGTISDFESALTDSTLLSDIVCAIEGCILADGYVTPSNYSCILSSIGAISYTADVIDAIVGYLTALGAIGLAQLSQVAGLQTDADCSACGWCVKYDFSLGAQGWHATAGGTGTYTGSSWISQDNGAEGALDIESADDVFANCTSFEVIGYADSAQAAPNNRAVGNQSESIFVPFDGTIVGAFDIVIPFGESPTDGLRAAMYNITRGGGSRFDMFIIRGLGDAPAIPSGGSYC